MRNPEGRLSMPFKPFGLQYHPCPMAQKPTRDIDQSGMEEGWDENWGVQSVVTDRIRHILRR